MYIQGEANLEIQNLELASPTMSMRMIFLQSLGQSCVVDAIIEEGMGERNLEIQKLEFASPTVSMRVFFLQSVGGSCFVDAIIEEEVGEANLEIQNLESTMSMMNIFFCNLLVKVILFMQLQRWRWSKQSEELMGTQAVPGWHATSNRTM